jgi:ABC-type Zn uptake system ZnuABC Zn-binding protein ZnuA
LASVLIGHLIDFLLVSVPLYGVALVDVRQEGEDTDDLAFAFFVVFLLPDQLKHIWLDVSFAKQFVGESNDALSLA